MRVVLITSVERGLASRCVPELLASPSLQVVGVISVAGAHPDRLRRWRLKARKITRIGLGGAINGYRMRAWFDDREAAPIDEVCAASQVELFETPYLNSPDTVELLQRLGPDLGLSLGNGFMASAVYEVPRLDMLNVHCERLPHYQNASSIIWPIHNNETHTGLTVHRIARQIDTGDILLQQEFPIKFGDSLAETVAQTIASTYARVPGAVRQACEQYPELIRTAVAQQGGQRYTTPSLRQYRQMLRNHQQLRKAGGPATINEAGS